MTKILATLGPSSSSEAVITKLVDAGANGFRLNFSHGTLDDHRARAEAVRNVAKATGKHITLLMDLQGPKIRIGEMSAPVLLVAGEPLVLDLDPTPGDSLRVSLPHPEILGSLHVGDVVLVNDGVIRLVVEKTGPAQVVTRVGAGGVLSSRKGVNVPGRALPMSALTAKDMVDLEGGLKIGVDWVALSFVQTAEDVLTCKERIAGRAKVMTKIETQASIDNLEAIVDASDGLMVARGDLGVELPTEDVPPLQKRMIALCRAAGKPVVVATQMLESMVQNPRPTRAEATDVANAAFEGADCVMLSAESASGAYPVEAVATMARIVRKAEQSSTMRTGLDALMPQGGPATASQTDAFAQAATDMAANLGAQNGVVVAFTETGATALRAARRRPTVPVVGLTANLLVARQLGISWGVTALMCPTVESIEEMIGQATQVTQAARMAPAGTTLVVVAGVPFGQAGSTNMLRVLHV